MASHVQAMIARSVPGHLLVNRLSRSDLPETSGPSKRLGEWPPAGDRVQSTCGRARTRAVLHIREVPGRGPSGSERGHKQERPTEETGVELVRTGPVDVRRLSSQSVYGSEPG